MFYPPLREPEEWELISTGNPRPATAVLIPFIREEGEWLIALEKRTTGISHPGQFAFPGGHRESTDRSFLQTALRETTEEMGIPVERITPVGKIGIVVNPGGRVIHGYGGIFNILSRKELTPSPLEVESIHFIPLKSLLVPEAFKTCTLEWNRNPQKDEGPVSGCFTPKALEEVSHPLKHEILFFKAPFGMIWGITGRFLFMVRSLAAKDSLMSNFS